MISQIMDYQLNDVVTEENSNCSNPGKADYQSQIKDAHNCDTVKRIIIQLLDQGDPGQGQANEDQVKQHKAAANQQKIKIKALVILAPNQYKDIINNIKASFSSQLTLLNLNQSISVMVGPESFSYPIETKQKSQQKPQKESSQIKQDNENKIIQLVQQTKKIEQKKCEIFSTVIAHNQKIEDKTQQKQIEISPDSQSAPEPDAIKSGLTLKNDEMMDSVQVNEKEEEEDDQLNQAFCQQDLNIDDQESNTQQLKLVDQIPIEVIDFEPPQESREREIIFDDSQIEDEYQFAQQYHPKLSRQQQRYCNLMNEDSLVYQKDSRSNISKIFTFKANKKYVQRIDDSGLSPPITYKEVPPLRELLGNKCYEQLRDLTLAQSQVNYLCQQMKYQCRFPPSSSKIQNMHRGVCQITLIIEGRTKTYTGVCQAETSLIKANHTAAVICLANLYSSINSLWEKYDRIKDQKPSLKQKTQPALNRDTLKKWREDLKGVEQIKKQSLGYEDEIKYENNDRFVIQINKNEIQQYLNHLSSFSRELTLFIDKNNIFSRPKYVFEPKNKFGKFKCTGHIRYQIWDFNAKKYTFMTLQSECQERSKNKCKQKICKNLLRVIFKKFYNRFKSFKILRRDRHEM